jgi:hypothetical protein
MTRSALPVFLLVFAGLTASAQQPATGSVSGHVTASDTQRPARFALVTLYAVPAAAPAVPDVKDVKNEKDLGAIMGSLLGGITVVTAQTGVDGSFSMKSVEPGEYYIFATQAGYETPRNFVQEAVDAGADMKKPLPGIPVLHVSANGETNADVTMTRGAALYGKVVWDDGTPISGVRVTVEPASGTSKKLPPDYAMMVGLGGAASASSLMSTTDDLGRFRLAGLAPGDYIVQASLTSGGGISMQNGKIDFMAMATAAASPLVMYAPGAFHRSDAKPVTLAANQEQGDEIITFNLSGTHTVSGHVSALDTHASLNAGSVKLTDASDSKFSRTATIDANGNYSVTFVPSGTYALAVTGAAIKEPSKKSSGMFQSMHTVRSFEDGKATVVVAASDVAGQNVDLQASKKTEQDIDAGALLGGMFGGSSDKEK